MDPEGIDTLVIGAGLAGLAAALRLHEAGRSVLVLEATDGVGGRVRTERVGGFLLDRGFQVYLDAYPEAGLRLDLAALKLGAFEPGAYVWKDGRRRLVMDVFRRPGAMLASALSPVGTLADKLRLARLRQRLLQKPLDAIWDDPKCSTADYLRTAGFSENMVDGFFSGFYGGIFLEEHLSTSSQLFEFTFKMFASGSATLPAGGMQAIPEQLAAMLPPGSLLLNTPVVSLAGGEVRTLRGPYRARHIVVATDVDQARVLAGESGESDAPEWNSTTCLYFDATGAPPSLSSRALIHLRGDRHGLIHHAAFPTSAQPGYAPAGKALLSATLLGVHEINARLESDLRNELSDWFGAEARHWPLLAGFPIRRSLPTRFPGHGHGQSLVPEPLVVPAEGRSRKSGLGSGFVLLHRCGDYLASPSIEGAILSGQRCADSILQERL